MLESLSGRGLRTCKGPSLSGTRAFCCDKTKDLLFALAAASCAAILATVLTAFIAATVLAVGVVGDTGGLREGADAE